MGMVEEIVSELESHRGVWLAFRRGAQSDLAEYDVCDPHNTAGVVVRLQSSDVDFTVTVASVEGHRKVIPVDPDPDQALLDLRAELDRFGATAGRPLGKTLQELVA
jgi:hypothetical protein